MDEIMFMIAPRNDEASWVFVILFAVFLLACFRVGGNFKFVGAFFRDMVVVRERENMFEATMRETSLIFLLLLLTGCSVGVILRGAVALFGSRFGVWADIPDLGGVFSGSLASALVCMVLCCLYIGVMWICYNVVGMVFTDRARTWLWVRGFTAGAGMSAALFFPLALVALAYPGLGKEVALTALAVLILVKIVFIVKGFRIFFTESSLWVVFLYYLCSLEIVPLVITFGLACSLLG